MASGILGIGTSALLANQRALATVSHNLANATVDGYSRQSVEMEARQPNQQGGIFFGNGVDVTRVRRNVDLFINQQINNDTALQSQLETQMNYLRRVDDLLAGSGTGLSSAVDDYFAAINDLSLDPASLPQREVALQRAATLKDRFQSLGNFLAGLEQEINSELEDQVGQVNALSASLAQLNNNLAISAAQGQGSASPDLLDQRDRLIGQLAELVPVSTAEQGDGTTSVFIGNGQALVVSSRAFSLTTTPNQFDSSRLELSYQGVSTFEISREINGGSLGGLLNSRQLALDPALNQLGRLAVGFEQSMNSQHRLGMDLTGAIGGDLFTVGAPAIHAAPSNTGVTTIGVAISDVNALTGADYRLAVDASGDYLLTNLLDDSIQNLGPVPVGPATVPVTVDGMTIDLDPAGASGDALLIQPTRGLARSFDLAISDPRALAAASPLLASSDIGNSGDAEISGLTAVDTTNAAFTTTAGSLAPPLLVEFTAPAVFDLYDNTLPGAPVLLEAGITYTPGAELFPTPGSLDFGYRMQISGTAAAGDRFQVDFNAAGVGDNSNMLRMIGLQQQSLFSAGTATYQESYQQLVGEVGARTSSGDISLEAAGFSLEQSRFRQQSVAGVNVDEEAANLLQFQQAYQAAAQTIQAADTLFQSLLEVI
ncbi:MAG TPA: flagellar hook-associated protein FlgK [Gammaproteobacteria bacterium]|nr:flagellar hook-associated protein FlgK [Gammaproteobacteria bacterium]